MPTLRQDSPSLLKQLFPNPTGNNGWEVVCDVADKLTGDLLKFEELTQANKANISSVTRYFADNRARNVVRLLLDTERMPFVSPRTSVNLETLFPDLAAFRKVVRFVSVAMFHAAGSGRSRDCARLVNVGMRIAIAPAPDVLIGTLVSIACQSIILRQVVSLASLIDADDLDAIAKVLNQGVASRAVYGAAFQSEYRFFISTVGKLETSNLDLAGPDDDDKRLYDELAGNKARFDAAKSDALDYARAELADVLRCIENPMRYDAKVREPQNQDSRLITNILLPVSMPSLGRVLALLTEVRMTGLYCSAWAYRKRTLSWPARLDEAAPRDLCKEVVSDKALVLEKSPGFDAIRIRSEGIPAADGQQRQMITVPATPKPS
ncbi:MAG: hypothetical protein RJA02_2039 [Armatimonadota bacterium]|jgi:hypothetical protein